MLAESVFLGRPRPRREGWEVPASARGSDVGGWAASSMSIAVSGVLDFGAPRFLLVSPIFELEIEESLKIRACLL